MEPSTRLLGTSQFAGNFRLDFHAKNERVVAKLYQADRKQGVFYLEEIPAESPLTYENLPELARSKINNFLALHQVRITPQRVSRNPPLGTPPISLRPPSSQIEEILPTPYLHSVKGPFIGSFPRFINSRFVLASCFNHHILNESLYDLERNVLVGEILSPSTLHDPPLHKNPLTGKTEVITDWDFEKGKFITVPREELVLTHGYIKTFALDGKLTITTPNGVHELEDAVSCHKELDYDYIDQDDYGPYPEKLVCDDTVVMGKQKVAILKNTGELQIWDLNSNSRIHSFSKQEVLEYGIAYQDIGSDEWICLSFFQGDNLIVRKSNYTPETHRYNVELLKFEFNPFTIKSHQFDAEEFFDEVFDKKVFTIYQQNLYFRTLGSEEPRTLFMELGFNVEKTYADENFLLVVAENKDIFLIDLIEGTKTQIIPSAGEIDFEKIDKIKFVDDCLFLIERSYQFDTSGFKLHSFDFSPRS